MVLALAWLADQGADWSSVASQYRPPNAGTTPLSGVLMHLVFGLGPDDVLAVR